MKKVPVLFFVLSSLIGAAAFAEKPLGVEEFSSIDELAAAITSYFPKVQGEVKAVQGDRLTIALGKSQGLTAGVALTLWRDGKEIRHPVTGAVIGREEEEVGTVEVTAAGENSSTAVITKKLKEPRAGDRARITPKKINLALIPVRAEHPEILSELAQKLAEFGRFSVLDAEKVETFFRDRKQRDADSLKEMGRAFNLDVVMSVGVYPSEGKQLITVRMFYPEETRPLDTIVAMLSPSPGKEALGEVRPFFAPVKEKTERTPQLPVRARYFAAADLDGDGRLEYVFSDGARLYIYRLEQPGWSKLWTEPAAPAVQELKHINLDVADINGDGRPEIFVTAMVDGRIVSTAAEYQNGTYRRIAELPVFLRVLAYPGRGRLLIGQGYDPASFFAGQPRQYVWSNGTYAPGKDLGVPKGVGLYGFVFAEFGERNPLVVAMDEKDRLLVYSKGAVIWKSEEQYPSVDTFVYRPATGIDAVLKPASDQDKMRREKIRGKIFALDINGDGKDEILVPKNIAGKFLGGYKEAEMEGMSWTGARLEQDWNIKEIPGAVLDFQAAREDKKEAQILALVRTSGGLLSKQHEQVVTYSVK